VCREEKDNKLKFEYSCGERERKKSLLINIMSLGKEKCCISGAGWACACQVKTVYPVSIGVRLSSLFPTTVFHARRCRHTIVSASR
jgi:hypothetical protein